jgi:hypothetical protein
VLRLKLLLLYIIVECWKHSIMKTDIFIWPCAILPSLYYKYFRP